MTQSVLKPQPEATVRANGPAQAGTGQTMSEQIFSLAAGRPVKVGD